MARQTSFTSFNKRPRSIRLVLTELFSGRVSARLTELEERVFELEKRINAQATAIANLGTTVGMEKVRNSVASRVLRETRTHKDSAHGKFSTKSTEANGLRSDFGNSGSDYRTSRPEPFDAGFIHHHTSVDDNYHHSSRASCHSGWDDGGCDTSSSSSYSGSCCD